MDQIACEMMLEFLKKFCPIDRVKLKENDRQFTRALVIHGAFIKNNTKTYPMNKKKNHIVEMMKDLGTALKNMYSFPEKEISIVVSKYLELD